MQGWLKKIFGGTALLITLIIVIGLVFLDTWIKLGLEYAIGKTNQAEVNVGSVSHSFAPFGVSISAVQVTDPAKPEQNRIYVEQVDAQLQLFTLLSDHIIVENVIVDKLQMNQPRAQIGKVYASPEELKSQDDFAISLPDIEQIIQQHPLKTPASIDALKNSYKTHRTRLETQFDELPSDDIVAKYKGQVEQIKAVDFEDPASILNATEQFKQLKQSLQQDRDKVKGFRDSLAIARTDVQKNLADLRLAQQQDYGLVSGLVGGDAAAVSQLTQAYFGEQADLVTDYILQAYQMLNSDSDKQEEEVGLQSQTDIWIKQVGLSVLWQGELIEADVKNITTDHQLIQQPTSYQVDMGQSELWQYLKLLGQFEIDDNGMQGLQSWDVSQVTLPQSTFIDSPHLIGKVLSGLLTSKGKVAMFNSNLDGKMDFLMEQLQIDASGNEKIYQVIADTLANTPSLSVSTLVSGETNSPGFAFSSDFDNQLKQAISASLTALAGDKLAGFKSDLDGQVTQALGDIKLDKEQIDVWLNNADGLDSQLEELIGTELPKNNLLDKVKGSIFKKLLGS